MAIFLFRKKRRIYRIISIVILISIIMVSKREIIYAQENLSMYSLSYALMDGETKRVLPQKDAYSPMANASTTKILTCILTLESCSLENMVTVSSNAAVQPRVKMGLEEGKKYLLKDEIYGN